MLPLMINQNFRRQNRKANLSAFWISPFLLFFRKYWGLDKILKCHSINKQHTHAHWNWVCMWLLSNRESSNNNNTNNSYNKMWLKQKSYQSAAPTAQLTSPLTGDIHDDAPTAAITFRIVSVYFFYIYIFCWCVSANRQNKKKNRKKN